VLGFHVLLSGWLPLGNCRLSAIVPRRRGNNPFEPGWSVCRGRHSTARRQGKDHDIVDLSAVRAARDRPDPPLQRWQNAKAGRLSQHAILPATARPRQPSTLSNHEVLCSHKWRRARDDLAFRLKLYLLVPSNQSADELAQADAAFLDIRKAGITNAFPDAFRV
jgi:hypothetical protein